MLSENTSRSTLKSGLQFLLGVGIVAGIGLAIFILRPQPDLPKGWLEIVPPSDVMALAEFHGEIWAGGKDGLYRIDPLTGTILEKVEVADGPRFKFTYALLVVENGDMLWVGHNRGLSRYDGQSWQTLTLADGLSDDQVLSFASAPDQGLWIGTRAGLSFYDHAREEFSPQSAGAPQTSISVLFIDDQEILWAGNGYSTKGGLFRFDGHNWESLGVEDGLPHHMVNSILQTTDGELWFGTGFSQMGGIAIFDGQGWKSIKKDAGLAGHKVRYLFQERAGVIWAGSEYDGIVRMNKPGWQTFTPENGLAGWEVKAMLEDTAGNLWLGTENGLTRIKAGAWP